MVERRNASDNPEGLEADIDASEQTAVIAEPGEDTRLDPVLARTPSRRKLLRAGMIGAPVAASLLSRPAMATGGGGGGGGDNNSGRCTTSGYGHIVSAGTTVGLSPTSVAGPEDCDCKKPYRWVDKTYWQNNGKFYDSNIHLSKKLVEVFPSSASCGLTAGGKNPWDYYSTWKFLQYSTTPVKELISLYLCAATGRLPITLSLDLDTLFDVAVNGSSRTIYTETWHQSDAQDFIHQFFS